MKNGFSRSFQVVALSLLASSSLAAADSHVLLNDSFYVRLEPSRSAKVAGPLKDFNWQPLTLSDVNQQKEWVKLTAKNGSFGYVHRKALTKVELKPDYELRSEPNLQKSRIIGRTGKTKGLVFTGKEKTVSEGKRAITWKEAWTAGRRAWVAAKAFKTVERLVASSPAKAEVKPAPKPTVAAPNAKPVVAAQECVNTPDQFQKNPRLIKAFGSNQPFTDWNGDYGISLQPSASGGLWTLKIPDMVISFMKLKAGEKKPEPVTQIPLKVCLDKNEKPFVNAFGHDYPFTDAQKTKIELQYGSNTVEFTRSTTVR